MPDLCFVIDELVARGQLVQQQQRFAHGDSAYDSFPHADQHRLVALAGAACRCRLAAGFCTLICLLSFNLLLLPLPREEPLQPQPGPLRREAPAAAAGWRRVISGSGPPTR